MISGILLGLAAGLTLVSLAFIAIYLAIALLVIGGDSWVERVAGILISVCVLLFVAGAIADICGR